MRKIELLAPAGNMASVLAAINGGADAIYIGEKNFSARRRAGNFDLKELEEISSLCHNKGVKVYIAMNILIKDSELPKAIDTLNHLADIGIDGLILQDLGLTELIGKYYPMLSMQTSTQGSVYGLSGVRYFEDLGFQRVVLPREMPLKEIADIRKETDIELKIFIHGALCYAYSGQCLMSALIGGRSGNRGLCAQPCRKNYKLYDKQGQFVKSGPLISTKDLNTVNDIQKIVDVGVDALKIEGRMKQPAYVYAVTKAYRNALDGKAEATEDILQTVFNRDFTKGLLFEDVQTLNQQIAKKKGRLIGRVEVASAHKLVIHLHKGETLESGDGIAFGDDQKTGWIVRRLEKTSSNCVVLPPNYKIRKQMQVFKTKDNSLESALEKAALKPLSEQKEPLSLHLVLREECPVQVQVSEDVVMSFEVDILPQKAKNRGIDLNFIKNQLEKLGDNPYTLKKLTVDMPQGLFLKKSELNALRRKIVDKLTKSKHVQNKTFLKLRVEDILPEREIRHSKVKKPRLSLELKDSRQLELLPENGLDEVVVPLYNHKDIKNIRNKRKFLYENKIDLNITFPKVIRNNFMKKWENSIQILTDLNPRRFSAKSYDVLYWLKRKKIAPVQGDTSLNIFNNMAIDHLEKDGVTSLVLSMEMDYTQIREVTEVLREGFSYILPVYGYSEMMVTDHCPFACTERHCETCLKVNGACLTDERNQKFRLYKDPTGHIHLYNSHVLALYRELERLPFCDEWRLYWTEEKASDLQKIIAHYCKERPFKSEQWIENLPNRTRGLIHRGVH